MTPLAPLLVKTELVTLRSYLLVKPEVSSIWRTVRLEALAVYRIQMTFLVVVTLCGLVLFVIWNLALREERESGPFWTINSATESVLSATESVLSAIR